MLTFYSDQFSEYKTLILSENISKMIVGNNSEPFSGRHHMIKVQ